MLYFIGMNEIGKVASLRYSPGPMYLKGDIVPPGFTIYAALSCWENCSWLSQTRSNGGFQLRVSAHFNELCTEMIKRNPHTSYGQAHLSVPASCHTGNFYTDVSYSILILILSQQRWRVNLSRWPIAHRINIHTWCKAISDYSLIYGWSLSMVPNLRSPGTITKEEANYTPLLR